MARPLSPLYMTVALKEGGRWKSSGLRPPPHLPTPGYLSGQCRVIFLTSLRKMLQLLGTLETIPGISVLPKVLPFITLGTPGKEKLLPSGWQAWQSGTLAVVLS